MFIKTQISVSLNTKNSQMCTLTPICVYSGSENEYDF